MSKEQRQEGRQIAAAGNSQLHERVHLAGRRNGVCRTAADLRTHLLQVPASKPEKVGSRWLLQSRQSGTKQQSCDIK